MPRTPTRIALELTDDMTAIARYLEQQKNTLVAELVLAAEERIAVLTAHLADVRAATGMPAGGVVLTMVA